MKILKKIKGFTLIELMIVVAIVGILSAIAIPSYQESVRKSRRADAKGALLGLANAMERRFTETNSYKLAAGTTGAPTDTGTPYIYNVNSSGTDEYYNITIDAADEFSYLLGAEPKAAQASDQCGKLTLTSTGEKNIANATPGVDKADCW
jgi:type IV pilus assembly protein PilE